jgi:hypothetical protein
MKFSAFAAKTPIFKPIGDTPAGDSVASVAAAASKETNARAASYQDRVVDYCIEWERVVTTRVDSELKETGELAEKLNHYQNKVTSLRSKVNGMEGRGKESPKKLSEKLVRNEKKLDQAWRAHERSASKLCNLIEAVTLQGWKDLYQLVKASLQWEVERASGEYDIFARLPQVMEELIEAYEKYTTPPEDEGSRVPVALADIDEIGSETTGSYNPDDDETGSIKSSEGAVADAKEEEHTVPASSKRHTPSKTGTSQAPHSPSHVAQI